MRGLPAAVTIDRVSEPVRDVRVCRLSQVAGRFEACPEGRCAFWEDAAHRCALDELDLSGRADLAGWLLAIRDDLETAGGPPSG